MDITFFLNGPFNQYTPTPFTVEGVAYASAEHYMMWSKATLFGDSATAGKILKSRYSHDHQALGRQVTPFDPDRWDEEGPEAVYRGNRAKFFADPKLAEMLLATGSNTLAYASADQRWGIGFMEGDPKSHDPAQWTGRNWLGLALTRVREDLKSEKQL
ncbi:MAG: NADAR family protein [Rhodospirillum sp.]|nr:NADAR family protein [Rhodospirillum sp.]MCF8490709.1 NADAR family protein [Rhodospirillum sp.]MCF8499392.1 NADAR family protein [Rhodospirillum sp.]